MEKTCPKCGVIKDASEFSKHKNRKDGLQSTCKKCMSRLTAKWHYENREHVEEMRARWVASNRDHIAKYRAENRGRRAEYNAKWRAENRERRAEYMARWNEEHREHRSEHGARYYAKNRERILASSREWWHRADGGYIQRRKKQLAEQREEITNQLEQLRQEELRILAES